MEPSLAARAGTTEPATRLTLILSGDTIRETMHFAAYVDAIEAAFECRARGGVTLPSAVHIPAGGGGFHIKAAAMNIGPGYVAVKINGNFPDNRRVAQLPTIQGAIILCDRRDGFPLAILDSTEITAQRTAAATAVAARYLARPDSAVATIIGCGVQGRVQLQALRHVFDLRKVFVFDRDDATCRDFATEAASTVDFPVVPTRNLATATLASDVVVTCTSSRRAFLGTADIRSGTFIAAVGADNDDKQELDPQLLKAGRVVVDSLDQCAEIGELHHALQAGVMNRSQVQAELSDVIIGRRVGRMAADDIVIFDSTGSAIQDVAAASAVFERARRNGSGMSVKLA